jgi:Protein of unknown function (DUF2804)
MPEPMRAWRGPGPGRPSLPLPPERMPAWRGGRPLKRWTWVGAFGPELMLCAAVARIGPATAAWWAVWDGATFTERSLRRAAAMVVEPSRVVVPGVMELSVGDAAPVEVVSPHGAQYIWTRKRGGVRVRGTALGREVDAAGLVDESAGYHARRTAWLWSAGAGVLASGSPVAWNLVDGVHDSAVNSERTVWVDGEPRELPPQAFDGLAGVGGLRFSAQATRARRESLLLMRSDYEQPFGTFAGSLDGAGELREGWGVMERHAVAW